MTTQNSEKYFTGFKERNILIFIFLFAVTIRFFYTYFLSGFNTLPGMDEVFYQRVAANIVDGFGFVIKEGIPTTKKPPVYPYFMALVSIFFGKGNFLALRVVQILIGGICTVLIYFITKKLANGKIALISSILVSIDPLLIFISSWILAHIMVYLFISLAVFFCLKTIEDPSLRNQILSGVFWGLVGLSMGYNTFLFYPYIFIWGLIIFRQNRKNTVKIASTVLLAMTLTISIWTIRNYIAYKKFIPIVTNGGYRFRGSNNPRADGFWTPSSGSPRFYFSNTNRGWGDSPDWESWAGEADYLWLDLLFSEKKDYNDYEINLLNYKAGLNWIRENPKDFLKLLPKKFYHFWEPLNPHSAFPKLANNYRSAAIIFYSFIFPLFVYGIYLSLTFWKKYLILYLTITHSIIGSLIYYGDAQQRLIITPFLSIFAALSISKFIESISNRADVQ
ncbi:MAG: glycosyltransferase family 39 protein [bacterium]|nr:glycosyltransferase family 39 protein [bacterium]